MTHITTQNAQKTVTELVVRWVAVGFSAMGAAMTLGRIPIEITTRLLHHDLLHHEADYATRANVSVPEATTVAS